MPLNCGSVYVIYTRRRLLGPPGLEKVSEYQNICGVHSSVSTISGEELIIFVEMLVGKLREIILKQGIQEKHVFCF